MAIKYDGAVFDTIEELIEYKRLIEGKQPEKVVVVQEREPVKDFEQEGFSYKKLGKLRNQCIKKILTSRRKKREVLLPVSEEQIVAKVNELPVSEIGYAVKKIFGRKVSSGYGILKKVLTKHNLWHKIKPDWRIQGYPKDLSDNLPIEEKAKFLTKKQRLKALKSLIRQTLTEHPHKYNLTELAKIAYGKKVKGGMISKIGVLTKSMGLKKAIKWRKHTHKPAEAQEKPVFSKYQHRDYSLIADKLKAILKTEPKKYNYQQLTAMFFSDNTGCSALKISKLVKQLGLESFIRKGRYKAHTMGNHKVSDYDRYIRARAMEIMKAQKVDYITATKLAMADYKAYKQHKMPAPPQPAKPVEEHPFPDICESNGMLRMVVRDLLRNNIDNINIEYADNICVKEAYWTDFLADFMVNSRKIADHFQVADKFVVENEKIFYR